MIKIKSRLNKLIIFLIYSSSLFSQSGLDDVKELRHQKSFFTNPLLDCTTLKHSKVRTLINLEIILKAEIKKMEQQGLANKISLYYRELNTGSWIGVDEDAQYFPASLLKIPFMMAAFRQAELNPDFLDRLVPVDSMKSEYIQNLGNNGFRLTVGSQVTILKLMENMIIYSDNHSKDILVRHIEPHILESVFYDFGFDIYNEKNIGKVVSAREYSTFLRVLYNATYLNREHSNQALEILSKVRYKKGIPAGIPSDIVVAHKFGESSYNFGNEKLLHDCGIIYLNDKPYILSIMTAGTSFENLQTVIQSISMITYNHVNSRKQKKM